MSRDLSIHASAVVQKNFSFTFVTPMVMHGAKRKEIAEFRIPSVRGILRYWWRTLQDETSPEFLLEKEEAIFGGTTNQQKSRVSFILQQPITGYKSENVLPHKTSPVSLKSIEANKTAIITMQTLHKHNEHFKLYDLYFQYILHLAGMGQRARRGFGACQWEEHKWGNKEMFTASLKQILEQLGVAQKFEFSISGDGMLKRKKSATTPHPVLSAVWIGEGKSTPHEVLKMFGEASHRANRYGNLGSVKERFASPLWCTVRKIGDLYYPIVTEVQAKDERYTNSKYERDRAEFLRVIGVSV
ncbi:MULTISPECIES: type III-B CRISPR module RAMP protein Cmr1 [Aeribacillus]|jgi:CRISPR-associated protein Cmr1|uniref:Type III-B CRISPR module RAMP protein Cmr1 n=1 Tax=Aeribacillus pallidus TaxID=33936 RepID=A0A161ZVP6_9BACI|nr:MULTISPECIES: type III-B CRISPR module RAMP protein Cmr1 [Aeribacillus]KZN97407.1 type III-B CRISPR module RAMP protein Cmr1 [Aeribacillus pallidus]MDR9794784.1 type III-B CRISPR module RAMP protein Cmr1 [Aeribacillus pallidus]MDR9797809.1 type III-B CRISPR module RAMP protein Cmr1 [Aeribacillus pallidus]MED0701101.1 type III-B CRISPR module RAMP protein Cmr1 [Aeribacillus composti]